MKKILFISSFVPSNLGAAMKFTKKTIELLSQSYKVDLIYFKTESESEFLPENENIRILNAYNISLKERLLGIIQKPWLFPLFSVRYRRSIARTIKEYERQNHYDLVFLDHSQSFIYGKAFQDTPKILMSHDVIYQRVSRVSTKLMTWWCRLSESKMMHQLNANIFSFSTKDEDIIRTVHGLKSYVTCGNVDEEAIRVIPQEISNDYIFFGQWVRKDNLEGLEWFLKEVFPRMSGEINIKIIGRGLPATIHSLISELERVEYLGFVDNPYQLIANCRAVLSPLFSGAGVKFKVLESLACGTPVIGTNIAFEGIPSKFSDFMIEADTSDEYLNAMQSIDYDKEYRINMKTKFIAEYINPYLVKHIHSILDK